MNELHKIPRLKQFLKERKGEGKKLNEELEFLDKLEDTDLSEDPDEVKRKVLEFLEDMPQDYELKKFTIEGVPNVQRGRDNFYFSVEFVYTEPEGKSEDELVEAFKKLVPEGTEVDSLGGGPDAGFIGAEVKFPVKTKTSYALDLGR